jgi:serine/threonine protein kinase
MSALRHAVGDVIKERYTIREVLGSGAFGTVYRVEETIGAHTLTLACKEMHVLDDPQTGISERADALRMFQEESFLLGTIRHPNIPAAHFDFERGTWLACPICGHTFKGVRTCPDHGSELQVVRERFYLLMDFIEGDDLEVRLEKNHAQPLGETDVLDWALQVCDALLAVHGKGFSHRDIKPANIKIKHDTNQAMLIDFGLVKPSTVAGAYGTMPLGSGQRMGTLGYSPVLPQEQQQPDARTDILALGMTMYRLLTTLDPTEPDQLAMMRAKSPRSVNFAISPLTDTLILRAIKINPNERYADVAALRADLRAARYPVETACPTCGYVNRTAATPNESAKCERCERPLVTKTAAPAPPPPSAPQPPKPPTATQHRMTPPAPIASLPNPYWPRIEQIRAELSSPIPQLASQYDKRIQEIEELRAKAARASVGVEGQCPSCRIVKLIHVGNQPTGDCPICRQVKLQRRNWQLSRCPVCREGSLNQQKADGALPCPICKSAELQEEERRKFGLVADVWLHCPSCKSQWDLLTGGQRAVLQVVGADPNGIGAQYKGKTLTMGEWRRLAGRAEEMLECDACHAQFDAPDAEKLTLAQAPHDPFGVGAKLLNQTLSRAAWARISGDLPARVGTHACSFCRAEYDYDLAQQTLALVNGGQDPPDWAKQWLGVPVSLKTWYFKSAGKRSPNPGWVCPQCHSEWDIAANALKLVHSTQPNLQPYVKQILPAPDWHRRAAGAPTEAEIIELNRELSRLQEARAMERSQLQQQEAKRREAMHDELRGLLKQSVLSGFIPIKRMAAASSAQDWVNVPGRFVVLPLDQIRTPLRAGEVLRWEIPARKCTLVTQAGIPAWNREHHGMLTVTSERLFFTAPQQRLWQVGLHEIEQVMLHPSSEGTFVLEPISSTFKQRTAFEMVDAKWNLVLDGAIWEMMLSPKDVAALVRSLVEQK